MTDVHGTCADRFSAVRETFAANLGSGLDVGASVAVFLDGEPVVDLWGGHVDRAREVPWQRDSITIVWSVAKTMAALCVLVLADRGQLDLDAPVAKYWPEFAAAGKAEVTVRHVLSHSAGLPDWDEPLTVADLTDWEKATTPLAGQYPQWTPGSASGYHALTQGYLIGEIVHRISGRTLARFFDEEIATTLNADFRFTVDKAQRTRLAPILEHTGPPPAPTASAPEIPLRTLAGPRDTWTDEWLTAEIPAVGGYGNARSIAAIHAALASDVPGLLSSAMREEVLREQTNGVDLVLGVPLRFGLGFALNAPDIDVLPNPDTCWWDGWGGSAAVVDLNERLSFAYVCNQMRSREYVIGDRRAKGLLASLYTSIG